jgi:hypothetical protein
MTDKTKKTRFITTTQHAMIGRHGAPTDVLAPGKRTEFDEENDSHKYLLAQIEAGNPAYEHLSVVEVDVKAEGDQKKQLEEQLAEADKIAAKQRNEEAQAAQEQLEKQQAAEEQRLEDGAPSSIEATDFPPGDVEAQKLAEQSGAGQRASTQEDVVEESSGGRSGRRSSRGSRS